MFVAFTNWTKSHQTNLNPPLFPSKFSPKLHLQFYANTTRRSQKDRTSAIKKDLERHVCGAFQLSIFISKFKWTCNITQLY